MTVRCLLTTYSFEWGLNGDDLLCTCYVLDYFNLSLIPITVSPMHIGSNISRDHEIVVVLAPISYEIKARSPGLDECFDPRWVDHHEIKIRLTPSVAPSTSPCPFGRTLKRQLSPLQNARCQRPNRTGPNGPDRTSTQA
jgi:hypothetical protein